MGLIGPGGVHAIDEHIVATAELAADEGVPADRVFLHAFTDGRDTPPRSADRFLPELVARLAGRVTPATVIGRYFAMDRDGRWDRTRLAYDAIVHATGERAPDASSAIAAAYARGEADEFIRPTVLDGYAGVADGDVLIHLNFRADRARQLTRALALDTFGDEPARPPRRHADRVPGAQGPAGGGRLPPARGRLARRPPLAPRQAPAPRGRDREVRARHLLLQRRRGAAVSGRGARPRPVEPRGRDLRPRAGDGRLADHRCARGRHRLRAPTTSSSPTTPIPTWSATPGSGTRRSGRPRRSTPASGASRPRCSPGTACSSSPPTTATSRRCATRRATRRRSTPPRRCRSWWWGTRCADASCATGSSPTWRPRCAS